MTTPTPTPRIKRAPNSFILFRNAQRVQIVSENPNLKGKEPEISKIVGELWHKAPHGVKNYYAKMAEVAGAKHKRMYPNYSFRPGKSRDKGSKKKPKSAPYPPARPGDAREPSTSSLSSHYDSMESLPDTPSPEATSLLELPLNTRNVGSFLDHQRQRLSPIETLLPYQRVSFLSAPSRLVPTQNFPEAVHISRPPFAVSLHQHSYQPLPPPPSPPLDIMLGYTLASDLHWSPQELADAYRKSGPLSIQHFQTHTNVENYQQEAPMVNNSPALELIARPSIENALQPVSRSITPIEALLDTEGLLTSLGIPNTSVEFDMNNQELLASINQEIQWPQWE